MRFLLLIPARKGSSFHGKNRYPLKNIPLIDYTIRAAIDSECGMKHVVVSTNDHYIAAEAGRFQNIEIHNRGENLSAWDTTLDELMYQVSFLYKDFDYYVCLQPTSPLRKSDHITEACKVILREGADSLISVRKEFKSIWKKGETFGDPIIERLKNRQEEVPAYVSNGAIFISKADGLRQ